MSASPVTQGLRSATLAVVRRGPRTVIWHAGKLGVGNHLYLWLAAWLARRRGEDLLVLSDPALVPWLERFPALRGLVVDRRDVRLRDRRTLHDQQVFGVDHGPEDVRDFVQACLLPHLPAPDGAAPSAGAATLNVRRGDYYSDPLFRGWYGIDLVAYVGTAVGVAEQTAGPITDLHVVSDDIGWCRERLAHLAGPERRLTFAVPGRPFEHFADLARARRLVLTNSTFSYWGAHVSTTRYADNHAFVVAPWFHRRDIDGGLAWQLDPRWTVVRDIPGGWDS